MDTRDRSGIYKEGKPHVAAVGWIVAVASLLGLFLVCGSVLNSCRRIVTGSLTPENSSRTEPVRPQVPWDPNDLWARHYTNGAQTHGWDLLPLTAEVEYDLTAALEGPVIYGGMNLAKLEGQSLTIRWPQSINWRDLSLYIKSSEKDDWHVMYGKETVFRLREGTGAMLVKADVKRTASGTIKLYPNVNPPARDAKSGLRIATTKLVPAGEETLWGSLPQAWELYIRFSDRDGNIIPPHLIGASPASISLGGGQRETFQCSSTVYETISTWVQTPGDLTITAPRIGEFIRLDVVLLVLPSDAM